MQYGIAKKGIGELSFKSAVQKKKEIPRTL
jgi:hypothetical protein